MKSVNMTCRLETEDGEIYLAGVPVAPGIYREIETGRRICLHGEDRLPASLDGRVACYERLRASLSERWSDARVTQEAADGDVH
jgi:hypothetical protein